MVSGKRIIVIKEREENELNNKKIDDLSLPVSQKETDFSILFEMPVRKDKEKPGRNLEVAWDKDFPLVKGMEGGYVDILRITAIGARPGNHYHEKKKEIYFVLGGTIYVILEDPRTKEREKIFLDARFSKALYIKPGIAHVIDPYTDHATVLIVADNSNSDKEDEIRYEVEHQCLVDTA